MSRVLPIRFEEEPPVRQRNRRPVSQSETDLHALVREISRAFDGHPTARERADMRKSLHLAADRFMDHKIAGK